MERFTRDGLTFDVTDTGPTGGEPVVLLHGFPQDRTAWSAVTERLAAKGLRCLAPDQRGYSPDARPRSVREYRLGELVDDVVGLLDEAGLARAHVVGHDWGGTVAWAVADRHHERVASLTVLSTPHPRALLEAMRRDGQWRKSWYIGAFQVPEVSEEVMRRQLAGMFRRTGMPDDRARHYCDRFATRADLTPAMNWYRAAVRGGGGMRDVGDIDVPTTYLWGSEDFALGRAGAEATEAHVTGPYRFVEIPAGHWLPELNTDEVVAAVLDRVRGTAADE